MEEVEEYNRIVGVGPDPNSCYLQKFKLYQTHSNFYMVGRDKNRSFWKVLKISREESSDLNILEDPETYTGYECADLLKRISEGNKSCGGLKFVTNCYGIIGLTKLLGPYYMLLITKRRKIGDICGHTIYTITKRELIPIPNTTVLSKMDISKDEKRYKKLLCSVDLTKDFIFSYSYHVMCSLQKNLCDNESGPFLYDTMFVWNEYLTREVRQNLKNTQWTVALVHGFFRQVKLSVLGRDVKLTLIARRSRHYAGTRFLKRGVNGRGRVANDVETEQIVCEDVPEGCLRQMSSVVQNRGSIPLFWSQETSRLNLRPDIILSKKDPKYEATKLHFENLAKRYGNPIIILNLIKTHERKPRESILSAEFANAIRFINKGLQVENRLKFLHWDLSKHSRNKASHVLTLLSELSTKALNQTGIFYCQVATYPLPGGVFASSLLEKLENSNSTYLEENMKNKDSEQSEIHDEDFEHNARGFSSVKPPLFQKGVLRTNCIDCIDRTNVAQYAYGLVALGTQLHALGLTATARIDLDNPLAEELMRAYEAMGDTLALQYGGSAAHNKIFCERRGQWKAATQSQEFLRTLQRYYSNAYMDAEKQNAINVFLGYFQPQQGKPAIWELNSDQYHNFGSSAVYADENARSFMKRSFSDGSMLTESETPMSPKNLVQSKPLLRREEGANKGLSDSSPEISACESDTAYHRYTPSIAYTQISRVVEEDEWPESGRICYDEHGDACSFSNFDLDWISSSGNSCEEEFNDSYRSSIIGASPENCVGRQINEITVCPSEVGPSFKGKKRMENEHPDSSNAAEFSGNFVQWVANGGLLFY